VILCPEAADALDEQSGYQRDGKAVNRNRDPENSTSWFGTRRSPAGEDVGYGSGGGASRFFTIAPHDTPHPEGATMSPTREPVIHLGDCLEVLRGMPDNSVDCVVTDPPYGLSNTTPVQVAETIAAWVNGDREHVPATSGGFMGADWDSFVPPPAVWDEVYRVLKPGGHAAVFSGTRTIGLMDMSIRLAGFDHRDTIGAGLMAWVTGQGFPKSQDVSKQIDKMAGAEREVIGRYQPPNGTTWNLKNDEARSNVGAVRHSSRSESLNITAPATDEARKWEGWGTQLKPSWEPILLYRKPVSERTVAANVVKHGTGALNIDATRIGNEPRPVMVRTSTIVSATSMSGESTGATSSGEITTQGRFPANVILDRANADRLDQQSGYQRDGVAVKRNGTKGGMYSPDAPVGSADQGYGSGGGASRFFHVAENLADLDAPFKYCPKAPKSERPNVDGVQHPTVKPLAVMRWLVRLLTPPDGTVLDPFAGSGTTIEAALLEEFNAVGVEAHAPFIPLIQARIDRTQTAQEGTLL